MSDLNEEVLERLKLTAAEGTVIRSWCQHEGFKLFKKHFDDKINQARETWLTETDPVKTESLKRKAILWNEIVSELKKFMLSGDNALRVIKADENLTEASDNKSEHTS